MELVHLHTMEPLSAALVADTLVDAVPQPLLDPRGALQVRVHGPWRPADRWPGGIERCCGPHVSSSPATVSSATASRPSWSDAGLPAGITPYILAMPSPAASAARSS